MEKDDGFEALSGPYFGAADPGPEAKIFLPGLISTNGPQGSVAFLDDGKLCVFSNIRADGIGHETYYSCMIDDHWTAPEHIPFEYQEWLDYTSPDGSILYFQSVRPTHDGDERREANTWVVEWTGEGWTEPQPLPFPANLEDASEGYPAATLEGSVYFFSSNRADSLGADIYRSRCLDGVYQEIERLPEPLNTEYMDIDPFVAPDESYILFGSDRPGVIGVLNTFISFRREDDSWTHPVFLPGNLNCREADSRVRVTPDGKYFFFYSKRPTEADKGEEIWNAAIERFGDGDIYWSDTSFVDRLKMEMLDSKCAYEVVHEELTANGLRAASDKLMELYRTGGEDYHFLPWEMLSICEELLKDSKPDEADAFHQMLLAMLPETYRYKVGYAVICCRNGRLPKSIELLRGIAAEDPAFDLEQALHNISEYLALAGEPGLELQVLKQKTEEFPNSYRARYFLAAALERLGKREEALEACRKAIELKPDSFLAKELLARLDEE